MGQMHSTSSVISSAPASPLRSEQQGTIDQQLGQIEARLRSLDEQQAERDARRADFQARQAELDALHALWESQQAALDEERRDWESKIALTAPATVVAVAPVSEPAASPAEPLAAESETETRPVAEAETVITTAPSKAAPVDLAAILRKTGFQVDQADEESPSAEHVGLKGESSDSGPDETPAVDIAAPVPQPRKPAGLGEEQEVSIDEYMTRLLARLRGDSAPSSAPVASVPRAGCRRACRCAPTKPDSPCAGAAG